MIYRLDLKQIDNVHQIYNLFQASYRIEADLLKATDFPPLNRKVEDFLSSDSVFYGLKIDETLAAAVEVKNHKKKTHIQSLVVHPAYFRKGLGQQIIHFVLDEYDSGIFTVETGAENEPAIRLYKKLGFNVIEHYDTEVGIRKVRLKLTK